MKTLYVGTKSKARVELLNSIGLKFKPIEIEFKESYSEDPITTIKLNSVGKYLAYTYKVDGYLATFDTVVYLDGITLGKPRDRGEAFKFLKMLSGRDHEVYTGMVIGYRDEYLFDYAVSRVFFDELDDDIINWYLDKGEYINVAGGYSIQGYASIFVKGVEGCYYNIVGLPLNAFLNLMKRFGLKILEYLK